MNFFYVCLFIFLWFVVALYLLLIQFASWSYAFYLFHIVFGGLSNALISFEKSRIHYYNELSNKKYFLLDFEGPCLTCLVTRCGITGKMESIDSRIQKTEVRSLGKCLWRRYYNPGDTAFAVLYSLFSSLTPSPFLYPPPNTIWSSTICAYQ